MISLFCPKILFSHNSITVKFGRRKIQKKTLFIRANWLWQWWWCFVFVINILAKLKRFFLLSTDLFHMIVIVRFMHENKMNGRDTLWDTAGGCISFHHHNQTTIQFRLLRLLNFEQLDCLAQQRDREEEREKSAHFCGSFNYISQTATKKLKHYRCNQTAVTRLFHEMTWKICWWCFALCCFTLSRSFATAIPAGIAKAIEQKIKELKKSRRKEWTNIKLSKDLYAALMIFKHHKSFMSLMTLVLHIKMVSESIALW